MNGADWSKRYPGIVEEAARIKASAVMDAEVVCLIKRGIADFDMLHSRTADHLAVACAFDLLMHTVTMYDANRFVSASWLLASF
jgi:ATP-dependent DNA ligase